MVGNTGTLMTMSIVRSKLRKRDESFNPANTIVNIETQQQHEGRRSRNNSLDNNHYNEVRDQKITFLKSDRSSPNCSLEIETITFTRTSGGCSTANSWVFPPKAPSPNIYNSVDQDAMAVNGRNGLKGLKKQFSGRFKRLVSHKKDVTAAVPPELKSQLKTIYVY